MAAEPSARSVGVYIRPEAHEQLGKLAEADNRPLGREVEYLIFRETQNRQQSVTAGQSGMVLGRTP